MLAGNPPTIYGDGEQSRDSLLLISEFEGLHCAFSRHEFSALMVPAMIPPPFPFKAFVLAAVFEMNFWHFLLAIFAGRMVRFLILSVLVLKFDAQAVALTLTAVLQRSPVLLLLVVPRQNWGVVSTATIRLSAGAERNSCRPAIPRYPDSIKVSDLKGAAACPRRPKVCGVARKMRGRAY